MVRKAIGNNKLAAFVPPPLPSSLSLPPLPRINSHILYERSITHVSLLQVPKNTHDLDVENYADINDYEKLEYVGDRILSMCVDLIVHEVYPNMRQGVATMVHSNLVRNETLAQLADRYGITEKIRTSRDAQHVKNELVKVKGSAFEAWIAGVFFDYQTGEETAGISAPDSASPTAKSWPSRCGIVPTAPLDPGMTVCQPAPQPGDETQPDSPASTPESTTSLSDIAGKLPLAAKQRSYGEALDYVLAWLRPLYLQILDFVFQEMRKYQMQIAQEEAANAVEQAKACSDPSPEAEEEHAAGGALLALNVLCEQQYRITPVWNEARARPGIWRLTCALTLPDGQHIVKSGERPTKKLAKAIASLEMCRALKIMKTRKPESEHEADAEAKCEGSRQAE